MAQIKKGTTYDSGDNRLVTPENLNGHVENAILYKGAITEQSSLGGSETVDSNDQILISNTSDTSGLYPNKVSLGQVLSSGIPITTEQLNVTTNINAASIHTDTILVGDAMSETVSTETVLEVLGNSTCSGTGFTGIASGNNEAKQSPLVGSAIRWNTEEEWLEVWDGGEWVRGGGVSPFEASGGQIVFEPSKTLVPATFSSDGIKITITKGTAHGIMTGQVVELTSTAAGYTSIEGVAFAVTEFTFKIRTLKSGLSNVLNQACFFRKSGNHKIHVFNSSGNFTTGRESGNVEVLIVGGGGGCPYRDGWDNVGGGAGGIIHLNQFKLDAETIYPVVVGAGGVVGGNGGTSSFAGLQAFGGLKGGQASNNTLSTSANGRSGGNNIGDEGINPWEDPTDNTLLGWYSGAGNGGTPLGDEYDQWPLGTDNSTNANLQPNTERWVPTLGIGVSKLIKNYVEWYCFGGYVGPMSGPEERIVWRDRKVGGWNWGPNTGVPPRPNGGGGGGSNQAGASGVVIIRYHYKLS
jgi:hypothetical protein